jgi:hypothetical protein
MNDAVDADKETFWLISAEMAFKIVYRGYLEERCTPEAVEKRADVILENIGKRYREERGVGRYKWEIERDRARALAWLRDHRARFEELKKDFFFINECPENAQRFDVTFEDCEPPAHG